MPTPTIPLWGQFLSNGFNNIRDIWKTAKEKASHMTREQEAEAVRKGDQWVRDNILPIITTAGELIPQTSIPMAAYNASEAAKQGNYEEAFQHALTPVLTGSVSKGVNLGLKASEKAIDTAGKALKNADNYVTIQNALRTGKLRFGEPTTYIGIHQSKTPLTKVQFPFQRWDVTTHGADPNGFWLTLADIPNTTGTMGSRPFASRWTATAEKPLIQTGEVKSLFGGKNNTRNAIVKYGRRKGADAFEFKGIKDNALPQTDVVMLTEKTNPQYLGEFTESSYISPKTSYKSILMEEPIMGRGRPKKSSTEVPISPEAWDEMLFEDLIGEQGAINAARKASQAGKRVLKPITEAEKLGIPKGLRSNPKSLEDPYYWGYEQWNSRYNDAVNSGNWEEVQRLRDLHFKTKAPDTKVVDENGMPLHTYHGTMKHFTTFNNVNPKDIKFKTGGYHTADYDLANSVYGKGGYYNPANGKFFRKYGSVYDDYLNITNPFIDTPSHNISDIVGKLTRGNEYPNWGSLDGSGRVFIKNGGFDGVFVPRYHNTYLPTNSASQIKSAEPITWNGKGEIIPIVKRDNFRNPDIRYKQGGKIKSIFNPQQ